MPGRHVLLDLIDQDHAVAHDDAGKRDNAEDRDEAERRPGTSAGRPPRRSVPSGPVANTSSVLPKCCS